MSHVSNTLNRWHKVVERIQASMGRLNQRIDQLAVISITHASRVARAEQATVQEAEILQMIALRAKLSNTIAQIRAMVQLQNATTGISADMASMQALQNQLSQLESFLRTADRLPKVPDVITDLEAAAEMSLRTNTVTGRNTDAASVLTVDTIASLRIKQDELTKSINVLSDSISEKNATKVALEIDDEVRTFVGI